MPFWCIAFVRAFAYQSETPFNSSCASCRCHSASIAQREKRKYHRCASSVFLHAYEGKHFENCRGKLLVFMCQQRMQKNMCRQFTFLSCLSDMPGRWPRSVQGVLSKFRATDPSPPARVVGQNDTKGRMCTQGTISSYWDDCKGDIFSEFVWQCR